MDMIWSHRFDSETLNILAYDIMHIWFHRFDSETLNII